MHISGAQVLMSTENVTMSTRFCVLVLILQCGENKFPKTKHLDERDADLSYFSLFHLIKSEVYISVVSNGPFCIES